MTQEDMFTCPLCFPDVIEIGHIAGSYYLTKFTDGRYVIMAGQGHAGDEFHTFEAEPEVEPFDGLSDDQINDATKELDERQKRWYHQAEKIKMLVSPEDGYDFIQTCMEKGIYSFDRDGRNFRYFIFSYCGKLIRDYKSKG